MAPRFYRAIRALRDHVREGNRLLDIGAFPGSFPRLLRASYGKGLTIDTCGMPVTENFVEAMGSEGIEFRPCNLDPDIVAPADLPVGLPYATDSFEILTCMEIVEHLYSLKTLLTECHRVLAPGGVLYITTNNIMHRAGLLRIFQSEDTNLDPGIQQTTIWSDHTRLWRGHVRFYSIKQLCHAAYLAALIPVHTAYFEHYQDPDVIIWDSSSLLAPLRRWLTGRGERPPWNLHALAQCLLFLGPRSLANRFDSHLELILQKPADEALRPGGHRGACLTSLDRPALRFQSDSGKTRCGTASTRR